MPRQFTKVSEYNDFLCFVILKAPDRFPSDLNLNLDSAFETMKSNLPILNQRVKDETRLEVLKEMLEISFEGYTSLNLKKGIYALQEFQGIVWPKWRMEPKYEAEAIRRISANNT